MDRLDVVIGPDTKKCPVCKRPIAHQDAVERLDPKTFQVVEASHFDCVYPDYAAWARGKR